MYHCSSLADCPLAHCCYSVSYSLVTTYETIFKTVICCSSSTNTRAAPKEDIVVCIALFYLLPCSYELCLTITIPPAVFPLILMFCLILGPHWPPLDPETGAWPREGGRWSSRRQNSSNEENCCTTKETYPWCCSEAGPLLPPSSTTPSLLAPLPAMLRANLTEPSVLHWQEPPQLVSALTDYSKRC